MEWNGLGIIVGGITDFIIAGVMGVGLFYFLSDMEKKYLFLKGIRDFISKICRSINLRSGGNLVDCEISI
jgi:hypothetical protein